MKLQMEAADGSPQGNTMTYLSDLFSFRGQGSRLEYLIANVCWYLCLFIYSVLVDNHIRFELTILNFFGLIFLTCVFLMMYGSIFCRRIISAGLDNEWGAFFLISLGFSIVFAGRMLDDSHKNELFYFVYLVIPSAIRVDPHEPIPASRLI